MQYKAVGPPPSIPVAGASWERSTRDRGEGAHTLSCTLFVSLVYCAESTVRWFVVRQKHCWMVADSADKSKRTGLWPGVLLAASTSISRSLCRHNGTGQEHDTNERAA
jgi:hypothetical protein